MSSCLLIEQGEVRRNTKLQFCLNLKVILPFQKITSMERRTLEHSLCVLVMEYQATAKSPAGSSTVVALLKRRFGVAFFPVRRMPPAELLAVTQILLLTLKIFFRYAFLNYRSFNSLISEPFSKLG